MQFLNIMADKRLMGNRLKDIMFDGILDVLIM